MIDVSEQNIKIDEDSNFKDIVLQATLTMQKIIVEKSLGTCSLPYTLIKPDVDYHGVLEFDDISELSKKGEIEANTRIEKIKKDIADLEEKEREAKEKEEEAKEKKKEEDTKSL
jgi:hypothetical protein